MGRKEEKKDTAQCNSNSQCSLYRLIKAKDGVQQSWFHYQGNEMASRLRRVRIIDARP